MRRDFLHLDVHHIEHRDTCLLPESPWFSCVEYQQGWWLWDLPMRGQSSLVRLYDYGLSPAFILLMQYVWSVRNIEALHLSGLGDRVPDDKLWGDLYSNTHGGLALHVW